MTNRIAVLPNKPSAIGMAHPIDGPLKKDGSLWLEDQFTARRLTDGSIVRAPVREAGEPEKAPDAEADEQKAKVMPAQKVAAVAAQKASGDA